MRAFPRLLTRATGAPAAHLSSLKLPFIQPKQATRLFTLALRDSLKLKQSK